MMYFCKLDVLLMIFLLIYKGPNFNRIFVSIFLLVMAILMSHTCCLKFCFPFIFCGIMVLFEVVAIF